MTEQMDKPQPEDIDAERAILGSLLVNSDAFARVHSLVATKDFHRETHRTIYDAILTLARRGEDFDLLTVKAELARDAKRLERAGGSAYVSSLLDGIPDIANVERYARIVRKRAKSRDVIVLGNSIMHRAIEGDDPDAIMAEIVAAAARAGSDPEKSSRPLSDVVAEVHRWHDALVREGRTIGIETGFEQLDRKVAIRRRVLIVVGAPAGHGKSAFKLNLAKNISQNSAGSVVGFYSLEMSKGEVADRMTAIMSGVSHTRIRAWKYLNEFERGKVGAASAELARYRERFHFAAEIRSMDDLWADARRVKAQQGLDAVFVDYLQLVRGVRGRTPEEEGRRVAEELFALAQDLDCAVIAGSQLNKDRQRRDSGRISHGDLKYASAIGDTARVVLLFQRPAYDEKADLSLRRCEVRMQLEKNNEGGTGDYEMHFQETTQAFREGGCAENECLTYGQPQQEPDNERSLFQ